MARRSVRAKKKLEKIAELNKDRFMEKVEKDEATGCWKWKGSFGSTNNYPQICFRGRTAYAHRVAWQLWKGEIDSHIFRNRTCTLGRKCVNPDHLEEGGSGKYYAELRRGQNVVVQLIPQVIDVLNHVKDCYVQVPLRHGCPGCSKIDGLLVQLKGASLAKPPKRGRPPKVKESTKEETAKVPAPGIQAT